MNGEDIEARLNTVKGMLDELSKELQALLQCETHRTPDGEEPNTQPFEKCIARVTNISMMANNIVHDLSVVKHNVSTLHDLLGCKE